MAWSALALAFSGCALARTSKPAVAPPAAAVPPASAVAKTAAVAQVRDREWAQQALKVLDTFEAAVADYHEATALPRGTARYRQLQDSAFTGFRKALADNEALWPETQRVTDADARDQFVFVMGNLGGFMTPTPDLYVDDTAPTLGDRIGRSLQNAVTNSAAIRPKLARLAAQH